MYPHTHILNRVISVTDTICLGPPDFRIGCGSWGLRKSGLCRKKRWVGVEAPSTWPWKPSPSFPHKPALHYHTYLPPSSSPFPGAVSSSPSHLGVTWYPKSPYGLLLPMLALDHQIYPCFHKSLHLDKTRKKESIHRMGRRQEGVVQRTTKKRAEAPTFLVTGARPNRSELGSCIQYPSHVLIGLGPCLGREWKIRDPETLLGLRGREVPHTTRQEPSRGK